MAGLPIALAALVAVVTWGLGGYEPWAMLTLELGAFVLAAWLATSVVLATSAETRARYAALGRSQKKQRGDVEILTKDHTPAGGPFRDPYYLAGYPFRKHGAGLLILLVTAWSALSLVPLPRSLLALLSPRALALRTEAAALLGQEPSLIPTSLAPFLTGQDLLLWIAYVLLFLVAYHLADSSRAVRRLTVCLVLVGIASGVLGLVQWLLLLSSEDRMTSLNATGTFGNRNHYAYFQEMLLLVALGWLASSSSRRAPGDRAQGQEAKARAALLGLGVAAIGLGLLFSLSRSGIAFGAVGGGVFLALAREGNSGARRMTYAILGVLLAFAIWIGVDPIVSRFEQLGDEVSSTEGRAVVWADSLGAVQDFWLTGSGLSSYQHVFPIYRSFGGRRFYSWAHNDYLQIAVELGLPGLLLALAMVAWAAKRARRARRNLEADSRARRLHAGYCGAAVAIALHSFTDFGLHLPGNAALFAIVIGIATGLSPSRRRRVKQSPTV